MLERSIEVYKREEFFDARLCVDVNFLVVRTKKSDKKVDLLDELRAEFWQQLEASFSRNFAGLLELVDCSRSGDRRLVGVDARQTDRADDFRV